MLSLLNFSQKGDQLDYSDLIDVKEIENNTGITGIAEIKDSINGKVFEHRLNPTKRELHRILKVKKLENIYY